MTTASGVYEVFIDARGVAQRRRAPRRCEHCRAVFRPRHTHARFCGKSCAASGVKRVRLPRWERFMAKVDTTGDCWEWTGALTGSGYGVFALSAKRTSVRAHRFMWELATRCRAGTRVICHRCDNRRCVRPSHLFIGTHADNMMDMRIKGRAASGSNSARSKLTERDVQVIREDRANGVRQMDLAERFGVTTQTIRAIERRNTWRHVR